MLGDDERIRTLERRIRLLAENVPDMISRYQYRPEPRFDYVSPACEELTGYTPEEHYSDPRIMLRVVHPDDRERMLAAMRDPSEDRGAFPLRWVRRDGSVVWTEQRHRLERDADGLVLAIEGIVRDVTEHVRFRQQLEYEALHDPVTGMANLRHFTGALGAAVGPAGPERPPRGAHRADRPLPRPGRHGRPGDHPVAAAGQR